MDPQRFEIEGNEYRLEPLSWQQNKWLAEHVFKDIDLEQLDFATMWDLFRAQGPLIMAISLIDVGMTRAEHSRRSFTDIQGQAEYFAATCTGAEVAAFAPHFFQSCRPDQLAMLIPGKALQRQLAAAQQAAPSPSPAPGEDGSSGVSSPSAAATSPSSPSSSANGDHGSPSLISVDASSGSMSTTPSSVGVA